MGIECNYMARISYKIECEAWEYSRSGFGSVEDATNWAASKLGHIMCNWGSICPDGFNVVVEVCDVDEAFYSDMYELRCGL